MTQQTSGVPTTPPPLDEPAARFVLSLKPLPHGCTFTATRLNLPGWAAPVGGWVFTPDTGQVQWVVADNRTGCTVGPSSNLTPDQAIRNLLRQDVPSLLDEDTLMCTCGHPSGSHAYGEPSLNPTTGRISGMGRGPCGHHDCHRPRYEPFVATIASECMRLTPQTNVA